MNRQSATYNLSNAQKQLFLTSCLGDGHIALNSINNGLYSTCCIHEDYIDFKKAILDNLFGSKGFIKENGFCKKPIFTLYSKTLKEISYYKSLSLQDRLNLLDELGIALWFYDDGSLHKTKLFYNLNTQKFSKEENLLIAKYFKEKWNIIAIPTIERKKDGKEFWYLRIRKYEGAFEIAKILQKYPISSYNYKIICSETIQKWSKLQEELKSLNIDINSLSKKMLSSKLKQISI